MNFKENVILSPEWVLHDRIVYFNIYDSIVKIEKNNNILSMNINHGTNRVESKYAYIVSPGIDKINEIVDYNDSLPITILSNKSDIQAVCHNKLDIMQIIFYKKGNVLFNNGDSVSVESPYAVMWNRKDNIITVSNPYCESKDIECIALRLSNGGKFHDLNIYLPQGALSGKSVSVGL